VPKSIDQQWAFERCFHNKGSLVGVRSRLGQIAGDSSTLPDESASILYIITEISMILKTWDKKEHRAESLDQFRKIKLQRGGDKLCQE